MGGGWEVTRAGAERQVRALLKEPSQEVVAKEAENQGGERRGQVPHPCQRSSQSHFDGLEWQRVDDSMCFKESNRETNLKRMKISHNKWQCVQMEC